MPGPSELEKLLEASAQEGKGTHGRPPRARPSRFQKVEHTPGKRQRYNTPDTLDIFQQIVNQQPAKPDGTATPESEKKKAYIAGMGFLLDLDKLKVMMRTATVQESYGFFVAKILPNAPPSREVPQVLKQTGCNLMGSITDAKQNSILDLTLPSVAEITRILRQLRGLVPQKWAPMMLALIQHITTISSRPEDYSNIEVYRAASARKNLLLRDLIDSWMIFHPNYRLDKPPSEAGWSFPVSDKNHLLRHQWNGKVVDAIGLLFRPYTTNSLHQVSAAAFASLVLLTDTSHTSQEVRLEARPFTSRVGQIAASVRVDKDTLREMYSHNPELHKYVSSRWNSLVKGLRLDSRPSSRDDASTRDQRETFVVRPLSNAQPDAIMADIRKRLSLGLRMVDMGAIEKAWSEVVEYSTKPGSHGMDMLLKSKHIFDYFIFAFTSVRRPRQAAEAWACMTRLHIKPTIRSWTSLLEGCRRIRDHVSMENVWRKLASTGIPLDATVWTSRINALIECGQVQMALKALIEMAASWKQEPDPITGAKFPIAPINAAVAGLIRLRGGSPAARRVLDWATEQGAKPDVITFNTLLRPFVKNGETSQIEHIFEMMKKQKVEADAGTFTVMLDGLFSEYKKDDPEEQKQAVKQLFDHMEAMGIALNMDTFAKMLHLLLHDNDYKRASANAILDYIKSRGLKPSTYMYTILVSHYFSRNPPDLQAVNELLDGMSAIQHENLDRVFWERVVRGYTVAGELTRAFDVFDKVANLGLALTLFTLEDLLRAVIRSGQMDSAKRLVDTVKRDREQYQPDTAMDQRYWRHGFWGLARDFKLLTEEDMLSLIAASEKARQPASTE